MTPIELSIENFGPYAGAPQRVDFTRLDRLFLVAGETGAGKTSLFDAMCFALYGRGLGTRDGSKLRSHFASTGEPTSVTFVFDASGARWKVRRTTSFERPKKGRAGTTTEEGVVALYRRESRDGEPTFVSVDKKPRELNTMLSREIIKLDVEEFSRILVLPQGEFQRFLEMTSAERLKLLEKLFPVASHQAIKAHAHERALAASRDLGELETKMREVSLGADPASLERAEVEASEAASAAIFAEEQANVRLVADEAALRDATLLEDLIRQRGARETELALLAQDTQRVQAEAARVARARAAEVAFTKRRARDDAQAAVLKTRERVEHGKLRMDELAAQQASRAAELEAIAEQEAKLPALTEQMTVWLARAGKLVELGSTAKRRELAASHGARSTAACVALDAQLVALDQARAALADVRTERDAIQESLIALGTLESRLAGTQSASAFLAKFEGGAEAKLVDDCEKAAQATADAVAEVEAALAEEEQLVARSRHAVAATLSEHLVDGEPCLVCGSTSHPQRASDAEDAKQLAALVNHASLKRNALEKASASASRAESACRALLKADRERAASELERLIAEGFADVSARASIETDVVSRRGTMTARLAVLKSELARTDAIEKEQKRLSTERAGLADELSRWTTDEAVALADIARVEAELGDGITATHDLAGALKDTQAKIEDLRKRIASIEAEVAAVRAASARIERELADLVASADALEGTLEAQTKAMEEHIGELRALLASLEFAEESDVDGARLTPVQIAECERNVSEHAALWSACEARLTDLIGAIGGREPLLLEPLAHACETAREFLAVATDAARNAVAARQAAAKTFERFTELADEHAALARKSGTLVELSRALDGQNPQRLDFPTYVLGHWLARVLELGSGRLSRLSSGRYTFVLDTTVGDARSAAGLEIDVVDSFTGTRRNVRTLSGGEKFMAALALALGLSDVIQERAGGVELDTLFIDEGFGSLDPESLDRALSILDELGQTRTVGVISHVEALKASIPCQLEVRKGPLGSTLHLRGVASVAGDVVAD